jgi:hypothetical protein
LVFTLGEYFEAILNGGRGKSGFFTIPDRHGEQNASLGVRVTSGILSFWKWKPPIARISTHKFNRGLKLESTELTW